MSYRDICDSCNELSEGFGVEQNCKDCPICDEILRYEQKHRPTFSRFPYQVPVEQICDFCANDIPCSECEFGV